jgi:hypothetical protein
MTRQRIHPGGEPGFAFEARQTEVDGQEGLLENVLDGLGFPEPPADKADQGRPHVPDQVAEGPIRRGRPVPQGFQEGGRIYLPDRIPRRLRHPDLDLDPCFP